MNRVQRASRDERWWSQGHGTLIEAADGWGSLRVALFAAGEGTVIFKNFRYRGLDGNER